MQHELTHLAKLHFLPEVTDRIRKFYIAPDGKEPIGETSAENLIAKEYGDQWRKASLIAGYFTNPELGGLPFSGDLGNQFYYYVTEKLAGPCPTQVEAYKSLYTKLVAGVSKLDYSLTVDPALALQIQPTLDGLRQCGVVDTQTLRAYLTADSPDWIPYIEPALTPEEVPLLDKPVIEALTTLFAGRRATLIALQNKFTEESSWPWSSLRFYSYEEAADDNWVRIYQSARLDGGGVFKSTFEHFLGDQAPACEMKLATNTAPYGVDYFDEHHSDCWRIEHAALIAAPTQATRTIESDDLRVPHEPRNVPQRPGPHPIY
jgi:hypothetical protein